MRKSIRCLAFLALIIALFASCKTTEGVEVPTEPASFLRDIRPRFFESLNFNSEARVAEIPSFLEEFTRTYKKLENEYNHGLFTSGNDLENMRLAGMYYSFFIHAIVRGHLDGFLRFEDIIGNREKGFFSNLDPATIDFKQKELESMMKRAEEVSHLSMNINGFNDRAYGFYLGVRQVAGRLGNDKHFNQHVSQTLMVDYLNSKMKDYRFFPEWNLLMSMLYFDNYEDSLNTFANPAMDLVLKNLNARLFVDQTPDLNGEYGEVLGPFIRFDMNMKKVNHILQTEEVLEHQDIEEIYSYITTMEGISNHVITNKKKILDSWDFKESIYTRVAKLKEVKKYIEKKSSGSNGIPKPELKAFFTSKDFRRVYQCYSCHGPVKYKN